MSHRQNLAGLRARLALFLAFVAFILAAGGPAAAAPAGRAVDETGELEVHVEDYTDRPPRFRYFLNTDSGHRHELALGPEMRSRRLLSGTRVRVRGTFAADLLTPQSGTSGVVQLAAAAPYASGVQKTAVLLVNFQDLATQPMTPSAMQSLVFGSVNSFYLENSFNTTSISGGVFGWYTLPLSKTGCSVSNIATAAKNAATAAGVNLSGYSRFVYVFPNIAACAWAGYGQIGGSPTSAWINGYFDRKVIAHELGHNLGLYHAHSLNCDPSPIGTNCLTYEYGDLADSMGNGSGHFSAYQKEYLGWLNGTGMPPLLNVQASGSYTLVPYAGSASGYRGMKILKGIDPVTGASSWYYLEYRQPLGFDAFLSSKGNLAGGVTVRIYTPSGGISELDMTPNSSTLSDALDTVDGALAVGKTYSDTAAGVALTLTRADSTGATLNVVVGGTTACRRIAPTVRLTATTTSAAAGTALPYTLAVGNNDTAACPASTFNLSGILPGGWSGKLAATTLSIPPGGTASTTLTVTSPTYAGNGTYTLIGKAVSANSGLGASAAASYTVNNAATAGTLSSAIATDKTAYTLGQVVTSTASVKSGTQPLANVTVTFVMNFPDGTYYRYNANTDAYGVATYRYQTNWDSRYAGTYGISARATVNGVSTSASTSFTVR